MPLDLPDVDDADAFAGLDAPTPPSQDLAIARRFIAALTGDPETPCTFLTFDDSSRKRSELARVLHGTVSQRWRELVALGERGAGVFVTVNATDLKGRKTTNIVAVRALFADFDEKDGQHPPAAWPVAPSIVVQSGGGTHAYWVLRQGEKLDAFESAQRRIIATFKSDARIHDLPRVMRLPGTMHRKGEPVMVRLIECEPERCYTIAEVLAPCPVAARPQPKSDGGERWVSHLLEHGTEPGRRNDDTTRLAGYFASIGMPVDVALIQVCEWMHKQREPLSDAEVETTVRSIYRAEQRKHAAAVFPLDVLPRDRAEFAHALAVETQTPVDLTAMMVLAAVAACAQRRYHAVIRPGWSEPVSLFVAVVAGVGERKSGVVASVAQPIHAWERDEAERMAPEVAEARARAEVLSRAREKAIKASDTDKAVGAARELDSMKVPTPPRIVVSDVTPERLGMLLAEQDQSIALLTAEGAGVFSLMDGRYSGGAPAFEVYLSGHAGDAIHVERVHRPSVHILSPALTLALAVQPEALDRLAEIRGGRGLGLLARFLYAMPQSRVGFRDPDPPPVPEGVRRRYDACIRRLLHTPRATLNIGGADDELIIDLSVRDDGRYSVFFNREAQARMQELLAEVEPRLAPAGDLRRMADWAGKLAGAVGRIAALFAVVEGSGFVSAEQVDRARALVPYLIANAKAAYARMVRESIDRARENPIAVAIAAGVAEAGGELDASSTELLRLVRSRLPKEHAPKSAKAMGAWVDKHVGDLRALGVDVGRRDRKMRRRYVCQRCEPNVGARNEEIEGSTCSNADVAHVAHVGERFRGGSEEEVVAWE